MASGKKAQRITLLTSPPVVGKYYLVPTVFYPWDGLRRAWPVLLPKHEDREHLSFPHVHYHVDPRFVSAIGWRLASIEYRFYPELNRGPYGQFQRKPLGSHSEREHPRVIWKRLKCRRADIPYQWSSEISEKLTPHFVGKQCRKSKTGWICPHKRVPLGSFAPVDGIITCPLHGLQINAESGKVVGPLASCQAVAL